MSTPPIIFYHNYAKLSRRLEAAFLDNDKRRNIGGYVGILSQNFKIKCLQKKCRHFIVLRKKKSLLFLNI